jgi:hypothetical protein
MRHIDATHSSFLASYFYHKLITVPSVLINIVTFQTVYTHALHLSFSNTEADIRIGHKPSYEAQTLLQHAAKKKSDYNTQHCSMSYLLKLSCYCMVTISKTLCYQRNVEKHFLSESLSSHHNFYTFKNGRQLIKTAHDNIHFISLSIFIT